MKVKLWGLAAMRMAISLFEMGEKLRTARATSSRTRNLPPYACLDSSPLNHSLWPSSRTVSPNLVRRTFTSPTLRHFLLQLSWDELMNYSPVLQARTPTRLQVMGWYDLTLTLTDATNSYAESSHPISNYPYRLSSNNGRIKPQTCMCYYWQ